MTSTELSREILGWFEETPDGTVPAELLSFGEEMHIVHISGGVKFRCAHALTDMFTSMYINRGHIKVTLAKRTVRHDAPMFLDTMDIKAINSIACSPEFNGYIILLGHTFHKETTAEVYSHVNPELFSIHFNAPKTALDTEESESFNRIIEFMSATIRNNSHTFQREILSTGVKLLFYELWDIIIRQYGSRPHTAVNMNWDNICAQFMYLVHTNCHEHHDVRWYANKMCITPEKLTGLLKKTYGRTANVLIDEAIMTEAKVFLRNPNLSIQEISEMLSFADQSTFGKFFKRHSGLSPANYRKGR